MDRPLFRGTRLQHMVRLLFVVRHCGEAPDESAPEAALSWMNGATRLQALDFWMRNPDYLADELLDLARDGAMADGRDLAREIFEDREPTYRSLPTPKYRFGAYQPLDDAVATLKLHGMVEHRSKLRIDEKVRERHYWLMPYGEQVAAHLVSEESGTFAWYEHRAALLARVANGEPGHVLKDRQYRHSEYRDTRSWADIPSIAERVRRRIEAEQEAA